jgi:hypothetical protein
MGTAVLDDSSAFDPRSARTAHNLREQGGLPTLARKSKAEWGRRRDAALAVVEQPLSHFESLPDRDARVNRRRREVIRLVNRRIGDRCPALDERNPPRIPLSTFLEMARRLNLAPGAILCDLGWLDYTRGRRQDTDWVVWPDPGPAAAAPARMRVGRALEGLRRFTGASLETVGREIGRTFSHVRNLERGRYEPDVVELVLLGDAYHVTLGTILGVCCTVG